MWGMSVGEPIMAISPLLFCINQERTMTMNAGQASTVIKQMPATNHPPWTWA